MDRCEQHTCDEHAAAARRDVHHGNGIQDILWEEDIAYISLHRCKNYCLNAYALIFK